MKTKEVDSAACAEGVSRRGFLRAAGSVAAGSFGLLFEGIGEGVSASISSASARKRVLVPAHLWVYAARQPKNDPTPILEQVFADMSYAGMDGVELMEATLRPADAVKRIGALSRQYRLPITGTSYGAKMWDRARHDQILEDVKLVTNNLAALGGRTFGTSVGSAPAPKTPEQLDAQADLLRKLIAICEPKGITLNLHNHTYEVENGMHDLKGTLARVPGVKLGPDLNWLVRGGVDPVEFISEYGDRLVYLHLRDQHANGRWSESLGEGAMDYKAIGQALRQVKFSGHAAIELAHEGDFTPTRPIRESLKQSRQFVRKTLGY